MVVELGCDWIRIGVEVGFGVRIGVIVRYICITMVVAIVCGGIQIRIGLESTTAGDEVLMIWLLSSVVV